MNTFLGMPEVTLRDTMIFGPSPEFPDLIEGLRHLEARINRGA